MMDPVLIEEQSRKQQTSKDNVAREYCQHLFLSHLYSHKESEKILFKGGTALRILWLSPRFSEDLDFSGMAISHAHIEDQVQAVCGALEREGLKMSIQESKKTSGGYLGKILFQWAGLAISIKLEVSRRRGESTRALGQTLVQNDYVPSYVICHLSETELVREKMQALIQRGKPRDYFDLYFILRSRLAFHPVLARNKEIKSKILRRLENTDINFFAELRQFLPASHHLLLKNFRNLLEAELHKALPAA